MYPVSQQQMPCRASVGAVEINIYNPTANACPPQVPAYQQCPGSQNTSVPGQPIANQPAPQVQTSTYTQQQPPVTPQQPVTNPQTPPAAAPVDKPAEAKKEEPKKPIVPLTDDYIKTLENYLNNQNADIRLQGIKEVLKRFKEDNSRKTDIALTNLLNKALQDPSQGVRLIALAILDADYAVGDDLTNQILQNMQKSTAAYKQDALTASNILLKKAGQNLNVVSTPENSQQPAPATGQKLNVVAG